MILYEFLINEIADNKELDYIIEYLIISENITIKEAKNLIVLTEQMHQKVEEEIKGRFKRALNKLITKYNEKIKKARQDVAYAQQEGKKAKKIKKLLVQIDNLKQEFIMAKYNLTQQFNKLLKELNDKLAKNKTLIKLKALNSKYPKGKYALAATTAGLAGYAGYKIAHNYMTKAARVCIGKSGAEKEDCIKKYKEMAKREKEKLKK